MAQLNAEFSQDHTISCHFTTKCVPQSEGKNGLVSNYGSNGPIVMNRYLIDSLISEKLQLGLPQDMPMSYTQQLSGALEVIAAPV